MWEYLNKVDLTGSTKRTQARTILDDYLRIFFGGRSSSNCCRIGNNMVVRIGISGEALHEPAKKKKNFIMMLLMKEVLNLL